MYEQDQMRPWTLVDAGSLRDGDLPPIEIGCWVAVAVDHGPGGYSYHDPMPYGVLPQELKVTEVIENGFDGEGYVFAGEPITMPGVTRVQFQLEHVVRVYP